MKNKEQENSLEILSKNREMTYKDSEKTRSSF
jgi:hypothetical protein